MFKIRTVNNLVKYLTGINDFLLKEQEFKGTNLKQNRLEISPLLSPFHEFCHFVESENEKLILPNLGLTISSKESDLREIRVAEIEYTFANLIFDTYDSYWFPDQYKFYGKDGKYNRNTNRNILLNKVNRHREYGSSWMREAYRSVSSKSTYKNREAMIEKLKHNIRLSNLIY